MFSANPINQKPNIAVIGAWDTKGPELNEITRLVESMGCISTKINIGVFPPEPPCHIDIEVSVFVEAIGVTLNELRNQDRPAAINTIKKGILKFTTLNPKIDFDGIIGPGGTNGTDLITAFMQQYPDAPAVCISTVAQHESYSYTEDFPFINLANPITDIGGGVNSINGPIIQNEVGGLLGKVWMRQYGKAFQIQLPKIKGLIAASQFGTTTPCVQQCAKIFKENGYATAIFHMVGSGGKSMEKRIRKSEFVALLEITPTELADLYGNGIFSAGADRLSAAVEMGLPQVFAPGCLDMINLGNYEEVIKDIRFRNRTLHKCNEQVTVMRTTMKEYQLIAHHIVEKLKNAKNRVIMLIPTKGLSTFDSPKNKDFQWYDPISNAFLFAEIKRLVRLNKCNHIEIHEIDCHINDPQFADLASKQLLLAIKENKSNLTISNNPRFFGDKNLTEQTNLQLSVRPRASSI